MIFKKSNFCNYKDNKVGKMSTIEPLNLYNWKDIMGEYNDTLIIGNGASISISPNFKYASLFSTAVEAGLIPKEVKGLFDYFETVDFEYVLRLLSDAGAVNTALEIEETATRDNYVLIRNALISVVKNIHISYDQALPAIPKIVSFLGKFDTVFSLNYDLILYWAILWANENGADRYFKDCFVNSVFRDDWEWMRKDYMGKKSTLVFYPHGNLAIATVSGETVKISRKKEFVEGEDAIYIILKGLMDTIEQKWVHNAYVPLFISEGSSKKKMNSIERNGYLNSVYETALPTESESLVVYGWSISDQDDHILSRLIVGKPKKIAISIYKSDDWEEKAYEMRKKIMKVYYQKHRSQPKEIVFYDSASEGCWKN